MKKNSPARTRTDFPLPRAWKPLAGSIAALLLGAVPPVLAGSDTWKAAPGTGNWNTPANWVGGTTPNSSADTATFGISSITGVSFSALTTVNTISFSAGASAFTITAAPTFTLSITGTGITNNSGITQTFVTAFDGAGNPGNISFTNSATAGGNTVWTSNGGTVSGKSGGRTLFFNTATAGSGTFIVNGGIVSGSFGGSAQFRNSATAGSAAFTTNGAAVSGAGDGFTEFLDSSTAANGNFTTNGGMASGAVGGTTLFSNTATAGNGTFTTKGSTVSGGIGGTLEFFVTSTAGSGIFITQGGTVSGALEGTTEFFENSTAANGTFTTSGATVSGGSAGGTHFFNSSTAGSSTLTSNGSPVSGASGGVTQFADTSTAGTATLTANGGTSGGMGGLISFLGNSTGGTARVIVNGNGNFDLSQHNATGVTTGSIEGTGNVFLGARNLTVGGNNLSMTLSGVIADGGLGGGVAGSFTKTGTGTLTLSGVNTYTGATSVSAGKLLVNGSLAGASAVSVSAGATLGGSGTVGAVTFATNAILAPGTSPGTLNTGTVTFGNLTQLNYELGTPNVVGGGVNDLTIVTGNLTLDGVLNITNTGAFGAGTYRLFNYTGALTDNAVTFGTVPAGFTAANLTLQTSVANQINLIVTGGAVVAGQFWDGANTVANNAVDGGTGTWNNTTTNWTSATGAANTNWQAGAANFSAGAGTVTLGESITATALNFNSGSGGYTVDAGVNVLAITGAGVTNASGVAQNFVTKTNGASQNGLILFRNSATAGSNTFFTNNGAAISLTFNGGVTSFQNTSSAGSGTFTNNGGTLSGALGGETQFLNTATAANGTFTNKGGAVAGALGGTTRFFDTATAGSAVFTSVGSAITGGFGGATKFFNTSTAVNGTFTNFGGTASGADGGTTEFNDSSTAGSGTFTNIASTVGGAGGGETNFRNSSSAGSATLIATAASVGNSVLYEGGGIYFFDDSTGGTARVIVSGNGKLDIAGHNAPGVTVGSIEGSGQVYLGSRNLTVGSNNLSTVFSGVIANGGIGTGSLTKIGTGTLILSGASTYNGDTTVNGGVLQIDGSTVSPNTIVNAGGTLGGGGTVGGSVVNAGTVSPGASPGTLHLAGNYVQSSAGLLKIEIAGRNAGEFDVLAVGGTASLDGTLKIITLGGFVPATNDQFTILTSVGSRTGTFSTVDQSLSTALFAVSYLPNAVRLDFVKTQFAQFFSTLAKVLADGGSKNHGLETFGLTPNQRAVALGIDDASGDRRARKLVRFLLSEEIGKLPPDFDRIAPEELASIFNLAVSLANVQTANLQRRMDDLRAGTSGFSAQGLALNGGAESYRGGFGVGGPAGKGGKMMEPAADNRWGVFVTGTGEFTKIGDTSNARGYDLNTGGFTLGVDYRVTPNFALGVMSGYARTGIDLNHGGRITVDGGKLGLYATYFTGGFYADAAVSGGLNGYTTRRSALRGDARGSENGGEVNALFATGYDWKVGALTLGPTASFQYGYTSLGSFTESGSLAPLHFGSQHGESIRTALGAKASYDWKIGGVLIRPEVRAAWQHEAGESASAITSSLANGGGGNFTTHGPSTGRDSLILGGGVAVQWSERLSTYVYYDGEIGRTNLDTHSISGGVRVAF